MKLQLKALSLALGAATLMAGTAWGEETTGIQPFGTAAIAAARLNVRVVVPNIVVLKVGSAGGTIDTVQFNVGVSGYTLGVNSQAYTGTIPPTLSVTPGAGPVSVGAWTNAAAGASVVCALSSLMGNTALPSGGVDITVASGGAGNLTHPGGASTTLALCDGATTSSIASLTTLGGSFSYGTSAPVTGYVAGNYGNVVTYTATTL